MRDISDPFDEFFMKPPSITPATKAAFEIGILTPPLDDTADNLVGHTLDALPRHLNQSFNVTYHANIGANMASFAEQMRKKPYDALWAINDTLAVQVERLYHEHGITIPALITAQKATFSCHSPHHINAVMTPADQTTSTKILQTYIAPFRKAVICTDPTAGLTQNHPGRDIHQLLEDGGTQMTLLPITEQINILNEHLRRSLYGADAILIPEKTAPLPRIKHVIDTAHANGVIVVSNDVNLLAHGADIVISPLSWVLANEVALALSMTLKQRPRFHTISETPRYTCVPINSRLRRDRLSAVADILPPTHRLLMVPTNDKGVVNQRFFWQ